MRNGDVIRSDRVFKRSFRSVRSRGENLDRQWSSVHVIRVQFLPKEPRNTSVSLVVLLTAVQCGGGTVQPSNEGGTQNWISGWPNIRYSGSSDVSRVQDNATCFNRCDASIVIPRFSSPYASVNVAAGCDVITAASKVEFVVVLGVIGYTEFTVSSIEGQFRTESNVGRPRSPSPSQDASHQVR